jgi:hypothetical protein
MLEQREVLDKLISRKRSFRKNIKRQSKEEGLEEHDEEE